MYMHTYDPVPPPPVRVRKRLKRKQERQDIDAKKASKKAATVDKPHGDSPYKIVRDGKTLTFADTDGDKKNNNAAKPGIYIVENFLDASIPRQKKLLDMLYALLDDPTGIPALENAVSVIFGKKNISERKHVGFSSIVDCEYKFGGAKITARPFGDLDGLGQLVELVSKAVLGGTDEAEEEEEEVADEKKTKKAFNFVLLNYYPNGNAHVGYHTDKEKTLDNTVAIAGLSIGAPRMIRFCPIKKPVEEKRNISFDFTMGDNSLTIMPPGIQDTHKHSVPRQSTSTSPRISLTFRHFYE